MMTTETHRCKVNTVDHKTEITAGVTERVPRNCAELNERWRSVAKTMEDRWNASDGRNFTYIVRAVLADPETNNGLDSKEFTRLAMGCGCCQRHSAGIFLGIATHVDSFSPAVPGEPRCECPCRHLARKMIFVDHPNPANPWA